MIVLVSGATATLGRYVHTGQFGRLVVPRAGASVESVVSDGLPWACDNDAYSDFDPTRFRRMLSRFGGRPGCLFCACPDVVGDPVATLARFDEWGPEVRASGLPLAFVGQDGCEDMELPWDQFDAFFLGGSTQWKESHAAMRTAGLAKDRGKWVHAGRVNTLRRIRKVWDWGCVDSIDGTTFSKWPDKYLPLAVKWIRQLERQPAMKPIVTG